MTKIVRPTPLVTANVSNSSVLLTSQYPQQTASDTYTLTLATTITGTVTYTLYYSYQDVYLIGSVTRWLPFSDMTDATVSVDFQNSRPITAIKLDQTAGTGSITLDYVSVFQI